MGLKGSSTNNRIMEKEHSVLRSTVRKAFTVFIHDKEYDVYDIEGKEHGGWNGEPKTWWLYYSDPLPDGVVPPIDSPHWEPYCRSINRHVWDIRFKQRNYTKEKWDSTDFRNSTHVEMVCNGKPVYSFTTTGTQDGLSYAMAKVQYLQTQMSEHPFDFFNPEKEIGRRIYFHGLPATIQLGYDAGSIHVYPDFVEGYDKKSWWNEYSKRTRYNEDDDWPSDFDETRESGFINWGSALEDQHIWWFRKDKKQAEI